MLQTKADAIHMADNAIHRYQIQVDELTTTRRQVEAYRSHALTDLKRTCLSLSDGLIPDLAHETVQQVAHETGALHLPEQRQLLHQRRTDYRTRVNSIAKMESFIQRHALIDPHTGKLTNEVLEAEKLFMGLTYQKDRYECDQFLWLYHRRRNQPEDLPAFQRFWRVMTLVATREKRALEAVTNRLEKDDLDSLIHDYESLVEKCDFLNTELQKAVKRRDEIIRLVDEHHSLTAWLNNFEEVAVDALRSDLAEHLHHADLKAVHHTIRKEGRMMIARCQVLLKKIQYFEEVTAYLNAAIRTREAHARIIDADCRNWRREPYGMLDLDQTQRLITQPDSLALATHTLANQTQQLAHCIHQYKDFHHYDAFLSANLTFIAYDAFRLPFQDTMPPEPFCRNILEELEQDRIGAGADHHPITAMQKVLARHQEARTIWEDWDGSFEEAAALEATLQAATGRQTKRNTQ